MTTKNQDSDKSFKVTTTSFLENMGQIYEEIRDHEMAISLLLPYDKTEEELGEPIDEIVIDDVTYRPIENEVVQKQIVYLPSEATEYGTTKELLSFIQKFIHTYVDLSTFGETISSYYVLMSWIFDSFETIPYLKFTGDYGTGKTRALKVIGSICYKPIFAGGSITPSPIFRLIEQFHGTLVIDEADFSNSDHYSEIVKILNCGYTKNMPVLRTEGDKNKEPKAFDVFSPKVIATRDLYKDLALESRCITEYMKGSPREDIPYQLPQDFYALSLRLRNMLLLFRFRHYAGVVVEESLRIPGVEPRINQIAMPILAIIEDEGERAKIREFIQEYDKSLKNRRSIEIPGLILSAVILTNRNADELTYKNIANNINKDRDEKSGEYKISPSRIGKINASILGFDHRRINGRTELIWNEEKAKELCNRYGIDIEELPLVQTSPEVDKLFPNKP